MPRGGSSRVGGQASSRVAGNTRRPDKGARVSNGGNDPSRGGSIEYDADVRQHYAGMQPSTDYAAGYNQAQMNQMNGFHNNNGGMPMHQPQQAASPLDVLMSAIAASAGPGIPQNGLGHVGNNSGMFGMGQMGGLGNMGNMGTQVGMGGPGQMGVNGPIGHGHTSTTPYDDRHSTALSLDQIFGHNGFSSATSAVQSAEGNPTPLPTTMQVNMLMNLLNGHGSQANMSAAPRSEQAAGDSTGYQPQQQVPSTPYQQTRSGRISRPPAQPAPFLPNWSQLSGMQGNQDPHGQAQSGLPFPSQSVLRAIQVLQQPGMEVIRQALSSTEWMNQMGSHGQGQARPDYPGPVLSYRHDGRDVEEDSYATKGAEQPDPESAAGQKRRRTDSDRPTKGIPPGESQRNSASNDSRSFSSQSNRADLETESVEFHANAHAGGISGDESDDQSARPVAWPKPARGKGSRLAMSKEEIVARRKERNKLSAVAHRERKNKAAQELRVQMEEREEAVRVAQERCKQLEEEVESLKAYIVNSGLSLPASFSNIATNRSTAFLQPSQGMQSTLMRAASDQFLPSLQTNEGVSGDMTASATHTVGTNAGSTSQTPIPIGISASQPPSGDVGADNGSLFDSTSLFIPSLAELAAAGPNGIGGGTFDTGADQLFDFNLFMNLDGFDDDDDDFQPETSPHNASGSESESDDEGHEQDGTPRASISGEADPMSTSKRRKGKSKRSRRQHTSTEGLPDSGVTPLYTDTEATPRDRDDDEFIDPEMEDEDLFLPIEDVPIPPEARGSGSGDGEGHSHDHVGQNLQDLTRDMMTALNVETRDQLAAVMRKLVESAGEGVGEDVREKLRSVMYLAQANANADQAQTKGSTSAS